LLWYALLGTSGDRQWDVTIGLEQPGPVRAAAVAAALVETLAAKAGMPLWPTVRIEAVREDVLEEQNARPTLPDLVSTPEAAEILGVSAQRLRELAGGSRQLPKPVYELKAGKLWPRDAIEAFGQRWDRKPGRPDRGALAGSVPRVRCWMPASPRPTPGSSSGKSGP
jgi:hypothetical protein